MLIQKEVIIEGKEFIYSYSDQHFYIEGGEPHDLYEDALDPIEFHRAYIETDIEIPYNDSEGNIIEEI